MSTTTGLFVSRNILEPRYVWDPTVHKSYGEDLSFLVAQLKDPAGDIVDLVARACDRHGVESYCVYKILGHYDVMVRFWATRAATEQLHKALEPHMEEHCDFRVTRAYYDDWATHQPENTVDDRFLALYEREIELVAQGNGTREEIAQAIDRLEQARLLHRIDPGQVFTEHDPPLIKFYCAVGRSEGGRLSDQDVSAVRDVVKEFSEIKLKSLYFGEGCHYDLFMKGVVRSADYPILDTWLTRLNHRLRSVSRRFRSTTFVILNTEAPEGDLIGPSAGDLGSSGDRLRRLLGEQGKLLGTLTRSEQRDVLALFDDFRRDFINSPFERYFLGCLQAQVSRDVDHLVEKMVYFVQLEEWANTFLRNRLFPSLIGDTWHDQLRASLAEREGTPRQKGTAGGRNRELGLGELARELNKLVELRKAPPDVGEDILGTGWRRRLALAADVRNTWAHARLKRTLSGTGKARLWQQLLNSICETGMLYNDLARWVGKEEPKRG